MREIFNFFKVHEWSVYTYSSTVGLNSISRSGCCPAVYSRNKILKSGKLNNILAYNVCTIYPQEGRNGYLENVNVPGDDGM